MKSFVYRFLEFSLVFLILLSVGHAFYQSSLPPAESAAASGKVGEIIEEIIPPETPPGEYIQKNLRKLAHFTEFFFLGLWTVLFVFVYQRKKWAFSSLVPFGFTIALFDETIQIFSKRGPSVKDIWIDVFGYCSSILLVCLIFLIAYFIKFILDRRYL